MNIVAKQITGRPGPSMAMEITVLLEWFREPAFLLGMTGQVISADRVVGDSVQFQKTYWNSSDNMLIEHGRGHYNGKLVIPLRVEAIRFIEESRRDQDVSLNINMQYVWQEAITIPIDEKGQPRIVGGQVRHDTASVQECIIKRSDWLKRLAEMGWQEYELFEVAKQPLLKDQNFDVALKRLEEAQTALRGGDYSGVLAKCRAAFESAAKYESSGDTKNGFESLLARVFKDDTKKQDALNGIIVKLSDYAHLGRHEQYPAIHIAREEAEFVFTVTVSMFSLITRMLNLRRAQ